MIIVKVFIVYFFKFTIRIYRCISEFLIDVRNIEVIKPNVKFIIVFYAKTINVYWQSSLNRSVSSFYTAFSLWRESAYICSIPIDLMIFLNIVSPSSAALLSIVCLSEYTYDGIPCFLSINSNILQ